MTDIDLNELCKNMELPMTNGEMMDKLGFQRPDCLCSSEYRAIYETIADVIDQYEPGERRKVVESIAEEFMLIAEGMVERMNICCGQDDGQGDLFNG